MGSDPVPPIQIEHIVMDGGSKNWGQFLEDYGFGNLSASSGRAVEALGGKQQATGNYQLRLYSEPDEGQTDAINQGLAKASGDILAYICSDDYYEPGVFAKVADIFEQHPEVDVVYGDGYFLEGDSGWKRLKRTGPFSVERLQHLNFIIQPATFWRRSVYERFGPLDASLHFCMDNEYWLRIAAGTRWHYLEQPLATARLHPDAKTSAKLVEAWDETVIMAERYGDAAHVRAYARRMRYGGAWWYGVKRMILNRVGIRLRQGFGATGDEG